MFNIVKGSWLMGALALHVSDVYPLKNTPDSNNHLIIKLF